MKTLKLLFATLIIGVVVSSCSAIVNDIDDGYYVTLEDIVTEYDLWYVDYHKSTDNMIVNKTPFKINNVTYSNWVGGVKGVRGYKIELQLDKAYKLDSIYFRNRKTILESKKNDFKSYIAIFTISDNPKKEFGNQVSVLQKNFPFELKNNEAMISFQTKKGIQYFKIENIKKVETKHFP